MFAYPQPQSVENALPVIKETLPRSSLGYTTNNVYPGFPPVMADGRSLVASYQPEAVLNNTLVQQSHIQSNWQYRKYLTAHADEIMQQNLREACNDMGYFERFMPSERGNAGPITQSGPRAAASTSAASDLKQMYLSRDELGDRQRVLQQSQEALFRQGLP
jgi:hypothetical protein